MKLVTLTENMFIRLCDIAAEKGYNLVVEIASKEVRDNGGPFERPIPSSADTDS